MKNDTAPVVLISGASTGFGRLIAETLAREGYRTFATMRDIRGRNASHAASLHRLAAHESLWLRALDLDVTNDDSINAAVSAALDATERIDVLVNNAGYGIMGLAEACTPEQTHRIMDTNFFGVVRLNRAVLPHMRAQKRGLIVHISSGAGRIVVPGMSFYCASKWAMEALAESYHYELAPLGIDSVIIEPAAYPTAVFGNLERSHDAEREDAYGATKDVCERVFNVLNASTANPQEVADAVLATIETPAGQRPLRQRIGGGGFGVPALNTLSAQVQQQVIDGFGIRDITSFKAG